MKLKKIAEIGKYIKPVHPNEFRHKSGLLGEITGYKNINNNTCYEVTWADGMKDYVLMHSVKIGNCEIVEKNIENN